MKSVLSFVVVCAIACTLAACKSDSKTTKSSASPGAMAECKCPEGCMKSGKCDQGCGAACCKAPAASPGAVGEKKEGCCSDAAKSGASMGAVGEKKSGCCSEAGKSDASMGAVGEKKSGCCSETGKTGASMGAVSDKPACTGVCPATGKKAS